MLNRRRCLSPYYACAELLWYLSRRGEVDMVCAYAPQYARYAEVDGQAHGAYGRRLRENINGGVGRDMLSLAVDVLRKGGESRQCVVSLWHPRDLQHAHDLDKKDLPCTLTWQFLARRGKLNMLVNMRSNDLWLGFPYDVFCFTQVQRLVAASCGLEVGWYQHHAGSLHLYEKHHRGSKEAMTEDGAAWTSMRLAAPFHGLQETSFACRAETQVRLGPDVADTEEVERNLSPAMAEVVAVTWDRWGRSRPDLMSHCMREAIRAYRGRVRPDGKDAPLSETG